MSWCLYYKTVFKAQVLISCVLAWMCASCTDDSLQKQIDDANDLSYRYHYVSLDSTLYYANLAYNLSDNYPDGRMEALNNIVFVDVVRMRYREAEEKLKIILDDTDNKIELLVANVQMMRLCQRESRNKEFYDYYWHAQQNLDDINSALSMLIERQSARVLYAKTEMPIILSAYLFYVGQIDASTEALSVIHENGEIQKDTAQLLNYFYNVGSGGFLQDGDDRDIARREFEYLERCYFMASRSKQVLWQANALQAMSEHLQDVKLRDVLIRDNLLSMRALNPDDVADSLLAGNFAHRAVELFSAYGDTYQTAGALRTLSDCYFQLGDSYSSIDCLNEALGRDTLINQSPSMIAAIREKLSINYSAINDKPNSDYNRNIYLDMHDSTRQDRELEARAEQVNRTSLQRNLLITLVCIAILFEIVLLYVMSRKRRQNEERYTLESMLEPLRIWKERKMHESEDIAERYEDILEQQAMQERVLGRSLRSNIEQRAKMSLINSVTPFIDRILGELNCLLTRRESDSVVEGRYDYVLELTDKINEYNAVLTDWIQLRKGELSLRIESFRLQDLFDIVKKGRLSFALKEISLEVNDTDAVVKADKTLTLFMINTIADNARKATPEGGRVVVSAVQNEDFVEVSIADTGVGMDEQQLAGVFNHQPSVTKQHGFGLMNCKGIIEKYRKMSSLFSVCSISAESSKGKGTVFRFRLPRGVMRMLIFIVSLLFSITIEASDVAMKARMFADSTYFSNLRGEYEHTLQYADSARTYINKYYKELCPEGNRLMVLSGNSVDEAAELYWLADSVAMNFESILDVRNETAVAALALHRWDVYKYNNNLYSRLYRETSSDPTLMDYVSEIQKGSEAKRIAIVLLLIILFSMFPTYYLLFYRHRVYLGFLMSRLRNINDVLLSDKTDEDKLAYIKRVWDEKEIYAYNRQETEKMNEVVRQICAALDESINIGREHERQIEMADDELRRLKYEIANLHIDNNVLDNCFSALKHETMYYPSRIRQLVAEEKRDIRALAELTNYYKELYTLLSMQAQRRVEGRLKLNSELASYLLDLLRKLADDKSLELMVTEESKDYNKVVAEMPKLVLTDEQRVNLFTPSTINLSCLVIRQIVREVGETTNYRGCGVLAELRDDGGTNVVLMLSRKMKIKKK